jgi:hypothetical protein
LYVLVLVSDWQRGQDEEAVEIRPLRMITVADRASSGNVSLTGTAQA